MDVASGELQRLTTHHADDWNPSWSPDGTQIAFVSYRNGRSMQIYTLDLIAGTEAEGNRAQLITPDGTINELPAWRPLPIAAASSVSAPVPISLTTVAGLERRHTLEQGTPVTILAFSPDGERLATANAGGMIKLWDMASQQKIQAWRAYNSYIVGLAFSPDGVLLASAGGDNTINLWIVESAELTHSLSGMAYGLDFSPDGAWFAAGMGAEIRIWDTQNYELLHILPCDFRSSQGWPPVTFSLAFSPDGSLLASGHREVAMLWSTETWEEAFTLEGHEADVHNVAISPDGTLVVSGSADATIKLWDTVSGEELRTLRGREPVFGVAFSPDGSLLASVSGDQTVKVWDSATGQLVYTLGGHTDQLTSVAFSPDGSWLVSGSYDGTVILWGSK